jgi:hypothetical protein
MKCNVDADDLSNAIVVDHYSEHHWVTQAVDGATEAERSEAYRVLQERGMSYGDVRRKAFANDYERFRRKIGAIEIPQVCIPRFIKEFVSWVLRRGDPQAVSSFRLHPTSRARTLHLARIIL